MGKGWSALALLGAAAVAAAAGPGKACAQQGTIRGRVTVDSAGLPVVGARVAVLGSVLVTETDAEGRYVLSGVPLGPARVRVVAIGYASAAAEAVVTAQGTTLDVGLSLLAYTLDQMVATATGERESRTVGNAITTVDVDSLILAAPITTMNDLLAARAAGVDVLPGGLTGASARVRVRGTNSLSLTNEPVYYVDGIRVTSEINSTTRDIGGTAPSRLNDLNPEDISSIEVVRGPSASTLYGTDAANGVIVIQTRRGRAGPPRFAVYSEVAMIRDFNAWPTAYRGWRHGPTDSAGVMDTSAAVNSRPTNGTQCLLTEVAAGVCAQDSVTQYNLFRDPSATPNGTGYRRQLGLQLSGGSEGTRYFVSGEVENETGYLRMPAFAVQQLEATRHVSSVPADQYRPNARHGASFRVNLHAAVSPRTDIDVDAGVVASSLRLPQTDNNSVGLLSNALGGPGNADNGHHGYRLYTPDEIFADVVNQDIRRFIGSATTNVRPAPWLASRVTAGLDFTSRMDGELCARDQCPAFALTKEGYRFDNRSTFVTYTFDGNVAATWSLLPSLSTRTTVGVQYYASVVSGNGTFGFDLPAGATTVTGGAVQSVDESTDASKTLGAFIEEQVAWRDRLYVTGGLRGDANSAFGRSFRAVYYPKLAVSWMLSEESFLPIPSWLASLRLRAAIGASGTQPGPDDALRYFAPTPSRVDDRDVPAITFRAVGNANLRPERATEAELGFDAALLHRRVTVAFTGYRKVTRDALISRIVAPSVGASETRFENLGSVRNAGIEAAVSAQLVRTPWFGWDVTISAATNHNRILRLGVPPIVGSATQQREGYPIDGLWAPTYTFSDVNRNGIIEPGEVLVSDSARYIGPSQPTSEVTITVGVEVFNHRLRVSGMIDQKSGGYQLNYTEAIRCAQRLNCRGLIDPAAPLWEQARVVAYRQTPASTRAGFIERADFTRFRELALTWQLPMSLAHAMHARIATLTVAGRNLHLWSGFSGMDPESAYLSGPTGYQIDFQTAPPPTMWSARLNLGY
jgi:TonB-linked SusC/RagA family outer membrane protein